MGPPPHRLHCEFGAQAAHGQGVESVAISQGFLLGVTVYVAVPSLMVFLGLAQPTWAARWATMALAVASILTIVGGTVGESHHYYLFGSAVEVLLLVDEHREGLPARMEG